MSFYERPPAYVQPFPIGAVEYWDPHPWLDAANILVAADEPLRALALLKLVPAYYRDHLDPKIVELENKIHSKLFPPRCYIEGSSVITNPPSSKATVDFTLRGREVRDQILELNANGIIPHLTELAPGTYWLPIGLREFGCKFKYWPIDMDVELKSRAATVFDFVKPSQYSGPHIFCAFEIIEHLDFEGHIFVECMKLGLTPYSVHISTPLYSYDGTVQARDWSNKDLGHIRAYTPREFCDVVNGMFRGYTWELKHDRVMHLKGILNVDK